MKLVTIQFCLLSCYFLLLRTKNFPLRSAVAINPPPPLNSSKVHNYMKETTILCLQQLHHFRYFLYFGLHKMTHTADDIYKKKEVF
jgi:hypothetical protein